MPKSPKNGALHLKASELAVEPEPTPSLPQRLVAAVPSPAASTPAMPAMLIPESVPAGALGPAIVPSLAALAAAEPVARPKRLYEVFNCDPRRRKLYLATCLDDFMNANALRVRSMVCFECQQGAKNRENFAADADVEGLLDTEIWGKLFAEMPPDTQI